MSYASESELEERQRQYQYELLCDSIKRERRYALLQASAVIRASGNSGNIMDCVTEATDLLAEIEGREQ